jgi:uncharacterized protein YfiM (DUF2279 family)
MKTLTLLIALLLPIPALASDWTSHDKTQHFLAGAVVSGLAYHYTGCRWKALAAGVLAGLAKEVYDSRSGGSGFDSKDLAAASLGAVVVWSFTF